MVQGPCIGSPRLKMLCPDEPEDNVSLDDPDNELPDNEFYSGMPGERRALRSNRLLLGGLILVLLAAVLLSLWFLLIDNDGTDEPNIVAAAPTPLTIPTQIPVPTPTVAPTVTVEPTTVPTPLPAGLAACTDAQMPVMGNSYLVATATEPLKQRMEPSASAERLGSYPPGTSGLTFTGDCVVNTGDQYVWWQIIENDTAVWVASDFVQPQ